MLLIILVILFFVLCLITGIGPAAMLGLILRKLRPRIGDARIEVHAPEEAVKQYELTDERRFELGPNSVGLGALPCTLRFEARISILRGEDELRVRSIGTDSYFSVTRAASGMEEFVSDCTLNADDTLKIDLTDGGQCRLAFRSFKYTNA